VREGISRFESENYEEQFEGGKSYGLRGISFRGFRGINDVPCVELESSRDEDRAGLGKEQEEVL